MLSNQKYLTEKLVAIIEASSTATLILNDNYEIEWCNESFQSMFQIGVSNIINNKFDEALKTIGKVSHSLAEIITSIQNDGNILKEFSVITSNKENRWFEIEIITLPILNEVQSYSAKISEITQRKNAELELQAAFDELNETEKELRQNVEDLAIVNEDLFQSKEQVEFILKKEKRQRYILEKALVKFRVTQNQMVQSEKLASLGQLTAGISHEINNAINFVYAGIDTLKALSDELVDLLNKYSDAAKSNNPSEAIKEVQNYQNELGYNTLVNDLHNLIADIKEGAIRTTSIVKGLHSFTKHEKDSIIPLDLHEGLNTTISLLRKQIHDHNIQVIKNYSKLPLVIAHGAKINQVFMNVLTNAIQALAEKKGELFHPKIEIKTKLVDNNVIIEIADNGIGIAEDLQGKIFDPFFTTKEVGKGPGLGMSISYQIIKEHNGDISFETLTDIGTTFKICLPAE